MSTSIKLVAVGDGAVGKTCLLTTFSKGKFPSEYQPTIFQNYNKDIVVDDEEVTLRLADTAGQEDHDLLRPMSYHDVDVVLICFAINSKISLQNVKEKWASEISDNLSNVPILLIGTKSDLREAGSGDLIPLEECQAVASEINAVKYIECSAKEGVNLLLVFEEAVRQARITSGGCKCVLL